jgi:arsenate reductase
MAPVAGLGANAWSIATATAADEPALRALLQACGLPTEDLPAGFTASALVAHRQGQLIGCVAVQVFGRLGLLRSVAVAEPLRRQGLASQLLAAAEAMARKAGIDTLWLLTNGATEFFKACGYAGRERHAAPAAIAATAQFAGLCPASSTLMSKTLMAPPYRVLVLCTGNSARSILGESILNRLGSAGAPLVGYSAGSHPRGIPNPYAIELLQAMGHPVAGLSSKSWDVFSGPEAPSLDIVITVCDQAAGETCPYWPGAPIQVHWGLPDPAAVEGSEGDIRAAFRSTYDTLWRRFSTVASWPLANMGPAALRRDLQALAEMP